MAELVTRSITTPDREVWSRLFEEYREFCGRPQNAEVVDQVWRWLNDADHEVRGIVAAVGDRVAGIAHFRSFARTVDANSGLHLDDLYIDRDFRGNGVARALLDAMGEIAAAENAEFVRWVTAEDNTNAQRLYDRVAERTEWVTYEQTPTRRPGDSA